MGRNKFGGSKHKKYARERVSNSKNKIKYLAKDKFQEYAFVKDILGNCRLRVICWDKKERIAHIRGKMRKRVWINKSDLILVSLRDYQDDKCDVIQKYDDQQIKILVKNNFISEIFTKDGSTFDLNEVDLDEIIHEEKTNIINTENNQNSDEEMEEEINIYDIDNL